MIPASFAGLLVAALAILPGAVYTWAYERQTGAYNVALTDRFVRFLGISAAIQILAAWPEYLIYRLLRTTWPNLPLPEFALAWLLVGLIIGLPSVAGTAMGRRVREGTTSFKDYPESGFKFARTRRFLTQMAGRAEAPTRAWDKLFLKRPPLRLRVFTSSGQCIGGTFAGRAYAGGPPTERDLVLEMLTLVGDGKTFGKPVNLRVYIPADKIEYIEIEDAEARKEIQS